MIYNLSPTTEGAYTLHFENLDGDQGKVDMVDSTPDRGTNRLSQVDAFRLGRRVSTEHLPTKIRPKKRKGKLPDYANHRLAQICSDAFRTVIEAHDPGAHQFEPVQIVWKDKSVDERPYYWFVPCTRLWSLDAELSNPTLDERGHYLGYNSFGKPRPGPIEPVFRKDIIGDHDLFVEAGIIDGIYMSERLKEAFQDAKLTGIGIGDPLRIV